MHRYQRNEFTYIILLNILVFIITLILNRNMNPQGAININNNVAAFQYLGAWRPFVLNGQWWRLITYAFAHGSLMHILFNMLALNALSNVVIKFTSPKFALITYFIAALVSGVITTFFTTSITVGASGAIYGLFGVLIYYAIRQSRAGYHDMFRSMAPIIFINLVISIMPGISLIGHLSGLVTGLIAGYIYDRKIQRRYLR